MAWGQSQESADGPAPSGAPTRPRDLWCGRRSWGAVRRDGACYCTFLLHLRFELGEFRLAAQGHHAHLTRPVDRHDHLGLAVALQERHVADFGTTHRQLEGGPLAGAWIVFGDVIRGPQIGPHVVVIVHRYVVWLHGLVRERDDRGFERLGIDP